MKRRQPQDKRRLDWRTPMCRSRREKADTPSVEQESKLLRPPKLEPKKPSPSPNMESRTRRLPSSKLRTPRSSVARTASDGTPSFVLFLVFGFLGQLQHRIGFFSGRASRPEKQGGAHTTRAHSGEVVRLSNSRGKYRLAWCVVSLQAYRHPLAFLFGLRRSEAACPNRKQEMKQGCVCITWIVEGFFPPGVDPRVACLAR